MWLRDDITRRRRLSVRLSTDTYTHPYSRRREGRSGLRRGARGDINWGADALQLRRETTKKNRESIKFKGAALRLAAAASILLIAAGAAVAQGPPPGAGAPGFRNPKGDEDARTN